jgi:hypothetical protein
MIRMNTDTPVGSEPGSGARSCTCSGSYGRRGVVNPLVRAAAVPGLAALRITRLSPWRPARIAAYAAADHGPGRLGGWLRDQPESAAAVAADHSGQRPATATGA